VGRGESADDDAKGLRLILLSFFFPLAIYLLILGFINRGRHPLLVSGVWDGIGLIFGVSGFLLFAGPAVLSGLSERWRVFWLLGKVDAPLAGVEGPSQMWIFLSILYFALIVSGTAYYLWRQRHLSAVYNASVSQVERALTDSCEQLGINPMRTGDTYLFGLSAGLPAEQRGPEGVATEGGKEESIVVTESALDQPAILEVDNFPLMRHVTLRWEPVESPLRRILETQLGRQLSETHAEDSLLGGWLLSIGFILLSFNLAGTFYLILWHIFTR
jgi:hypothetical protein